MTHLDLAESALKSSDKGKWKACVICAVNVGQHLNGFAHNLAERMGYSDVSRISDFADAGKAWLQLRYYMRASSRDRYSISVFTHAYKAIKRSTPVEVADFLLEVLEETVEENRPKDYRVKDWMNGKFGIPVRETTPKTHLKHFEDLVTWGAQKLDHTDRPEWDAATQTIRRILHEHTP